VQPGDLRGLADRGEIESLIPRQQQADVVADLFAREWGDRQTQRGETGVEGVLVRGRKIRKVIDTRRERFSLTAQALLLRMCPPPSVRAAPGVVVTRTAGWVGLP
jgi:hypothetical protein